jgi:arylsulfatase A-like enzyme
VQVSYYAQHLSVVTREKTLAKYKAKGTPDRGYTEAWAAMMEELDDGIGRLIDAVAQSNAKDNTWIFFTADNGGRGTVPGGDTSRTATNIPLTGAKHSLYEGGVRVPFVVRGPGVEPGSVCRVPVVGYDFLPTFHDLAGGQSAETYDEVDGISLKSLLSDPQADSPQRKAGAVIFHRPNRLFSAARNQTHKLMVYWKRDGSVNRRELFDLTNSPTEEGHNIAAKQAATADQLQQQLVQFLKLVDADKPPAKARQKRKKK